MTKKTVLTFEFLHETNTFNVHKTDVQAFKNRFFFTSNDAVRERGSHNTELAGFIACQKDYGWNDLLHVLSAHAEPSGVVTAEAFDYFVDMIIDEITKNKQRIDGILMALHGAMVVEGYDDGEGELLRRIRQVIGYEVPIAATLDLHANVSDQMCELANILVSFKTYPHIDMKDCGYHAGRILNEMMTEKVRAKTMLTRIPMLEEANGGRTDVGPMIDRVSKMIEFENNVAGCLALSINAGFPTDISVIGPTVLCCYDVTMGDTSDLVNIMNGLAQDIWEKRDEVLNEYLTVFEACAIAETYADTKYKDICKPIIIADYSDNPGAGAYGDGTNLLQAIMKSNLRNVAFAPMVDAEVASYVAQGYKVGDMIPSIQLGGKTDQNKQGGAPILIENAVVKLISDGKYTGSGPMYGGLTLSFGTTVVITIDGRIDVLVVTDGEQILDLNQFLSFGINIHEKTVIALKSMNHFRAAFEPIASDVLVCDSEAIATPNMSKLKFNNVTRPIFPLDKAFVWRC